LREKKESDGFICPNCGGEVPANAKACPDCGADENTGWSESTYLDGIDLPDDHDYEESLQKEFGGGSKSSQQAKKKWIIITGAVVLALFIVGVLLSVF
jgi:hypothetical protein